MALSGNIERKFAGPGTSSGWYVGIDWRVNSQSAGSNSSNVTASLYLRTAGSGYTIVSNPAKNLSLNINGNNANGSSTVGMGANTKKVLFTRTIDVGHDGNGNKTCSFSASATVGLTLNGTYYGTISVSGNGTFDQINLNSAPWWTSNDTRMENIRDHAVIPENWDSVNIDSSTATDNEQGGNLNYDLHRHVNGSYSAQIKWGGSHLNVTDHIGGWGQGTRFKYEAKVHDGHGLWAPDARWSWEYTKNTFTRASIDTISSISPSSENLNFIARTARNSGGGNGYVNTSFGYRIESLTSGVGIHGNPEHGESSHRDVHFVLGIRKNGVITGSSTHYLDYEEVKRAVAGNGYKGNIRLRVVSWNSYGSSGSYDFDVWVDLRVNPEYAKISYHADSYINHGGTNYYVPAHVPFKVTWGHVQDPLTGANCTYDVYYQVGSADWVHLGATSNNEYTAYLGSTAIGNNKVDNFKFIIRSKASYGNYSDAGGTPVTLWDYSAPSFTINSVTRNKANVVIAGTMKINSSITGGDFTTCHYRWNSGGPNSNNVNFNKPSGTGYTRNFTLTINASENISGVIHLATSDTIRDKINARINSDGLWGWTDVTVKAYMPVMSLTKKGLGINMRPNDNNYKFMVDGNVKVFGNLDADNLGSAGPDNEWIKGLNPTIQGWKTGFQEFTDEGFKVGNNSLTVYNNSNNGNVVLTRKDNAEAPNGTGKVLEIKSTGPATPGWGGFTYTAGTARAKILTFIFTAKIPTDRYLSHASNSTGDGSAVKWLTSDKGTGKWTEYAFQVQCGNSGSFSTTGFFYLNGGPTPTPSANLVWYLAKATMYESNVARFNITVKPDGVMEGGRYFDFHDDIATSTDFSVRLDGGGAGPHGSTKTLLISNESGGLRIGCQNSTYAHFTTDRTGGFYFDQRVELANTLIVKKGSEGHWNYSQIYFPAQANDPGRILHYESNNTSQLWLMPGDDPAASDEVIIGSINKTDLNFGDASWNHAIRLRADGHIAANGGITVNNGWQVPRSAAHGGYWGIHNPECQTASFMRTPDAGLIPSWANGEGQSVLGTDGWPFAEVYSRKWRPPSSGWTRFEDLHRLEFILRNCATHITLEAGWVNDHSHNDPYWRPDAAGHGLIGTSGHRWYVGYFHGGSFNSNRELKHDISKMDNEVLYNYIKDINTYTYRTIAGSKDDKETYRERNDLFLGSMIDELPTEIVMYDTEHGDGKSVEIYSYATMIAGGLKHAIKIIEQQGEAIESLQYKIEELEEKVNGIN